VRFGAGRLSDTGHRGKRNPEGWQAAYGPALNFPKSYIFPNRLPTFRTGEISCANSYSERPGFRAARTEGRRQRGHKSNVCLTT
jgi:hypothetical protein